FNTADLNPLADTYWDEFVDMIPLPTCPLNSLNDRPVVHTALLVDWFTPPPYDPKYSVGVFVSKWGNSAVFRHRWGPGHCPDGTHGVQGSYNVGTLRVFAPGPRWPFSPPPYLIYPTYW